MRWARERLLHDEHVFFEQFNGVSRIVSVRGIWFSPGLLYRNLSTYGQNDFMLPKTVRNSSCLQSVSLVTEICGPSGRAYVYINGSILFCGDITSKTLLTGLKQREIASI